MKIDLHCHYYPQPYVQELARLGVGSGTPGGNAFTPWEGLEARLAVMEEAKVDLEILSVSGPNVFFKDKKASLALAQICNDEMGELCGKYPAHFRGMITVPLTDVPAAIEELHRARLKPGMVGVTLGTNIAGLPLDSPEFWPFYEELDKLQMPAFIHPMDPVGMPLVRSYQMTASIGFLYETCIAATRLVLSGAMEEYPNFPIILCHLGGAIPFISNRIDHAARRYEQTRKNISNPPSYYYRQMYFDTAMTYGAVPLNCAHQYLGEDQIVLGTDYPFTSEYGQVVPSIESSDFLSDEAREKIFWKNATKILKLA